MMTDAAAVPRSVFSFLGGNVLDQVYNSVTVAVLIIIPVNQIYRVLNLIQLHS